MLSSFTSFAIRKMYILLYEKKSQLNLNKGAIIMTRTNNTDKLYREAIRKLTTMKPLDEKDVKEIEIYMCGGEENYKKIEAICNKSTKTRG